MIDKKIEGLANDALSETDLGGFLPVNIVAVARFFGFSVYEAALKDDLSGLIIIDKEPIKGYNTNKLIVVNTRHHTKRKRFTVAHELGHYFLNNKPSECFAHRDITGAYSPEERDANQFASAILMPEQKVRDCIKLSGLSTATEIVDLIVDTFNVSKEAAMIRLQKLGVLS